MPKMSDHYKARMELESAVGRIKAAAKELERDDLADDERFMIAWELGFRYLRDLENYRCP